VKKPLSPWPITTPTAGEFEAGGMVAAMLHAERVGDVDVAAPPGTATAAANWDGGCCGTIVWHGPKHGTARNILDRAGTT